MGSIDNNEILNFYMHTFEKNLSNDGLIEFLKKEYGFHDETTFTNILINNFILVQSEMIKDLKEINERIKSIDMQRSKLDSTSYEFRKLNYCKRINIEAKEEIEFFLTDKAIEYIKKRVVEKKLWERSTTELGMFLDVLPYNYSHFKRYFNPDYDYSTDTKYRFLLNHNPDRIQEKLELKSNDETKFYSELDFAIEHENLLNKVVNGIKGHHVLKKREELFETLFVLYENEKYQSFVNLAIIQVEGLFYDFCLILNDDIEFGNFGTLSVKAERVFSSNFALWLSMYPYFAFEAPIFRNKIAHNGILNSDNIKNFANELIFDLLAIINAIKTSNKLPYNLLGVVLPLREKINTLEYTDDDYSTILVELFGGLQLERYGTNEFFDTLKRREQKKDALEFYIIHLSQFANTNLFEECCRLTQVIHDDRFWDIIIENLSKITKYEEGKPYDFADFINKLANNYINEFEKGSAIKEKCIVVKRTLAQLKKN